MRVDALRKYARLCGGSHRECANREAIFAVSSRFRHPSFAVCLCDAGAVRSLAALLLVCCGGGSHPIVVADPEPAPVKPQRVHTIQPFELVLQGVPDTGVQRARLARHGEMQLSRDGAWSGGRWSQPYGLIVAVAEVDGDRVRVLNEDDDARVLVWIHRGDLAQVTTHELTLRPGLVLAAGTPLELDGGAAVGVIEGLKFYGPAPDEVGDLWDAAPPVRSEDVDRVVRAGALLREEARADAPIVAEVIEDVSVTLVRDDGDWVEVETLGPQVRARGWVPATQTDPGLTIGSGRGGGYGVSHSISIDLPAGACLYDDIDGEVIGVNLIARSRLANQGSDPGWYFVMVNSPWELLRLPVRVEGDSFEVCR